MKKISRLAILGAGNIGTSIARGLVQSGGFPAHNIILTRRRVSLLDEMKKMGFIVQTDNAAAVEHSEIIIIAVEPHQINGVLNEIRSVLIPDKNIIISVVTDVSIAQIARQIENPTAIVRAMPNLAITVRQSMTCLTSNQADQDAIEIARSIFEKVGKTLLISEEEMIAATALGACGIAFFLRAIRAASQGGIEIGFPSQTALAIAAQTARGAAALLQAAQNHPEQEIDKVTTPRGCTIAGLNRMEHEGFSSAMIKGITTSAHLASQLYSNQPK